MFGLSTELITYVKFATMKRFECWHFEHQSKRSDEGLILKASALESHYGGHFTLSYQLIC